MLRTYLRNARCVWADRVLYGMLPPSVRMHVPTSGYMYFYSRISVSSSRPEEKQDQGSWSPWGAVDVAPRALRYGERVQGH